MSSCSHAVDVLDREFLVVRAKLLEIAAAIDRMERATGSVADDPRMIAIHQALDVLVGTQPDRAEQIQLVFSREYDDQWQDRLLPGEN
jgi:hypothetical protein